MRGKNFPAKAAFVIANPKSKLLDQLREVLRVKHYSLRTEEAYVQWVRRYLRFHRKEELVEGRWQMGTGESPGFPRYKWVHPRELGAADVVAFLSHLATVEHVAAGTQNQALNAISFLYTQVLGREFAYKAGRVLRDFASRNLTELTGLYRIWEREQSRQGVIFEPQRRREGLRSSVPGGSPVTAGETPALP